MMKCKCIYEVLYSGKLYRVNDELEIPDDRAEQLCEYFVPLTAKQVEKPVKDKMIKKSKNKAR